MHNSVVCSLISYMNGEVDRTKKEYELAKSAAEQNAALRMLSNPLAKPVRDVGVQAGPSRIGDGKLDHLDDPVVAEQPKVQVCECDHFTWTLPCVVLPTLLCRREHPRAQKASMMANLRCCRCRCQCRWEQSILRRRVPNQ